MKRIILTALAVLMVCALPASAARGAGGTKTIQVYVAVPANAVTTVTPEQAVQSIQYVLGQPTDASCLQPWSPYDHSTWGCSVEGWFRHELGQVFDYTITVVSIPAIGGPTDSCGSWSAQGLYFDVVGPLASMGAGFKTRDRSMILTLGAGGWAGHFSPVPDPKVDYHFGMVGDWGVMENFDLRNACVPSWDTPARGFSHEFAGMLGMYVTAGYDEGGLFVGDPMSANEKRDLQKYSGGWLRSP